MNKMVTRVFPTSKMSDLVVAHPDTITVLERFGIALGFGDQYVKEIAERYNINLQSFISILQVFEGSIKSDIILEKEAIPDVLLFLKISHKYFEEERIPAIRELIGIFAKRINPQHGSVIISFFDGYMREVAEHFLYEDNIVFPYIDSIISCFNSKDYNIREFEKNHTDIEQKLLDLKNILIKYIPESEMSSSRIRILKDLITLEQDLIYHTIIEDHLLVPSTKKIERLLKSNKD